MEFLFVLLALVVAFLLGGAYGWSLRERHAARVLSRLVQEVEEVEEKAKSDMIPISIEKHNNTFYVYNKKTNQFMGQGSSREELEELLHKSFPGKRFGASEENLAEVGFLS